MLLCEYLFLFDYSVRQFERLAELVGLQRQTQEERWVNKEYLGKNTTTYHSMCIQFICPDTRKTKNSGVSIALWYFVCFTLQ